VTFQDVESRLADLAAWRQAPPDRPIPRLIAALRDPDLAVAKMAVLALRDRHAELAPLQEMLRDKDPGLRWRACTLAWWFRIEALAPGLARVVRRDPDPMVRAEAAWGLQCSRTATAARALLAAMNDSDRMVAHYAAWNLRVIQAHCPRFRWLKERAVVVPPLVPEVSRRRRRCVPAITDNRRAFEQLNCSVALPACRAPLAPLAKVDGRMKRGYGRTPAGVLVSMDGQIAVPARETEFYVACSGEALHVLVRCQYAGKGELLSRGTSMPAYGDNCVELFLDPTGKGANRYFQICVDPRNTTRTALARSPNWHVWQPEGHRPGPWQPAGLRTAVRIEKGWWNAEIAVPFRDLRLSPGRINKVWRINVTRSIPLASGLEVASWCNLEGITAHRPNLFGHLWLDAGTVVNASADVFNTRPLPLRDDLKGWTLLRGTVTVADRTVTSVAGRSALRWNQPIPFEAFEVSAEINVAHQVRFMFAGDDGNSVTGLSAAYLRKINEVHFSHVKDWRDWAPPYPGLPTIFKEVYPRLTHSRWYRAAVRVGTRRCHILLDGAVQLEMPRPPMRARYLGLAFVDGGSLRRLSLRPL
jgi:hypothetical protein